MKPFPLLLFSLLGLCTLLTGCSTQPKFDGISLTIDGFRPAEGAATGNRAVMMLRFNNESLIAIGFSGSTHKLYFNGTQVGSAVSTTPIGLPPVSTVTQDVTVTFMNAALVSQLLAQRDRPVVAYRLESVLQLTAGEERLQFKTASNGTVNLHALQSVGP